LAGGHEAAEILDQRGELAGLGSVAGNFVVEVDAIVTVGNGEVGDVLGERARSWASASMVTKSAELPLMQISTLTPAAWARDINSGSRNPGGIDSVPSAADAGPILSWTMCVSWL